MSAPAFVARGLQVAVLSAAFAGPVAAGNPAPDAPPVLAPKTRAAFDTLMAAKRFETAHVGEDARLSNYAAAVRTLIHERNAPALFQTLYDRGSAVTRLYALAAFWYLRPGQFPALVEAVRERDGRTRIPTQSGCIGSEESVAELLEKRSRDAVRLRPGTDLYTFMCATPKRGPYTVDFTGGAIPIDIVEGNTIIATRCAHPPPLPDHLKPR